MTRLSAEIETDSTTITSEKYDSEVVPKTITKSEETTKEAGANPGGPTGVATNIGTAGANAQAGGSNTNDLMFVKSDTTTEKAEQLDDLKQAALLALGSYVKDPTTVKVVAQNFDTKAESDMITAIGSSNFWDRFWDLGKTLLYVALLVGGLFVVVRTFKRTSEEFVPTGLTVGELMAGGLTQGTPLTAGAGETLAAESAQGETPNDDDDVEMITEEKKKLVMDFGLGEKQPERVTVEVLKDLINEKPDKMSKAARSWLLSEDGSSDSV